MSLVRPDPTPDTEAEAEAAAQRTRRAVKADPMERAHVAMEIVLLETELRDLNVSKVELQVHLQVLETTNAELTLEAARLRALDLLQRAGMLLPQQAADLAGLRTQAGSRQGMAGALKLEIGQIDGRISAAQNRLTVLRPDLVERDAAIAATAKAAVTGSRESVVNVGGRR